MNIPRIETPFKIGTHKSSDDRRHKVKAHRKDNSLQNGNLQDQNTDLESSGSAEVVAMWDETSALLAKIFSETDSTQYPFRERASNSDRENLAKLLESALAWATEPEYAVLRSSALRSTVEHLMWSTNIETPLTPISNHESTPPVKQRKVADEEIISLHAVQTELIEQSGNAHSRLNQLSSHWSASSSNAEQQEENPMVRISSEASAGPREERSNRQEVLKLQEAIHQISSCLEQVHCAVSLFVEEKNVELHALKLELEALRMVLTERNSDVRPVIHASVSLLHESLLAELQKNYKEVEVLYREMWEHRNSNDGSKIKDEHMPWRLTTIQAQLQEKEENLISIKRHIEIVKSMMQDQQESSNGSAEISDSLSKQVPQAEKIPSCLFVSSDDAIAALKRIEHSEASIFASLIGLLNFASRGEPYQQRILDRDAINLIVGTVLCKNRVPENVICGLSLVSILDYNSISVSEAACMIKIVIDMSKDHPFEPTVQEQCSWLLYSFAKKNDAVRRKVVQCSGLDHVLSTLHNFRHEPCVIESALMALEAILNNNDELCKKSVDCGAVEALLAAMQESPSAIGMQELGCRIITVLVGVSAHRESIRMHVGTAGGIQAVACNLRDGATHNAQHSACAALKCLSSNNNDANISEIVESNCISGILKTMVTHTSSCPVQLEACHALANILDASEAGRIQVEILGGVDCVLAAMRAHPTSAQLQERGCWVMHVVSAASEPSAVRACHSGAVEAIVAGMNLHSAAETVQASGCSALANLVRVSTGAGVCEDVLVSAVVAAMRAHLPSARVQAAACKSLRGAATASGAGGGASCARMRALGGVEALMAAIEAHRDCGDIQRDASHVLREMASETLRARPAAPASVVGSAGGARSPYASYH